LNARNILGNCLFLLFSIITVTNAQVRDSLQRERSFWDNEKFKTIVFKNDTIALDSFPIVSGTLKIKINNTYVSESCSKLEGEFLIFNQSCFKKGDSLQISYQTLPYALQKPVFRKDRKMIGKETNLGEDFVLGQGYTYNPFAQNQDFNDFKGLEYSGSFSRGVSLGNRQDLILNSGFNLQVGGKIGDVEISGAISDNNIPLQPEGNTQQLQDFDRIFLQFKLKKSFLTAGDYDLKRPEGSYFLNYYRRLQGGQIGTAFKVGEGEISTDAAFAISKGSFTRNSFMGQEGNQGPYRLKGANGETFLIVLAGTERVFMDGELLSRGADNDYVIDYNLGEIRFTNKRLITKDKRIQIEFSYSDLDYLRTINTFNTAFKQDKNTVRISWYSEQDAKNQPSRQAELSDSARAVLRRIGNDIDNAFISGASIPEEGEAIAGLVKYKLIDTLVSGTLYDSVFVYSSAIDSAIFTVRFSQISSGGHYIKLNNAVNGTVYAWVAPDSLTGALRGTHEPIELLATPKKRQMLNVGGDYQLGKNGLIQADVALSNSDVNTYSRIGNNENLGIAGRISILQNVKLSESIVTVDSSKTQKSRTNLILGGHYEYVQHRFEVVEPYRGREFQRDWNTGTLAKTNENLFSARLGIENNRWGSTVYEFGGLLKDSVYNGVRHLLTSDIRHNGLVFNTVASYLQSKTATEASSFFRPRFDLSYSIKQLSKLKFGIYGEQEQNRQKMLSADTLSVASFYYNVLKFYAELPANEGLSLKASAQRRYDYSPQGEQFKTLTVADEMNFGGDWKSGKASQLQWNLNYRNLRIEDTAKTTLDPKETYLGRVEYNLNIFKGFIRLNTIYELGAGQQQKLAYNYVEVDKGMGTHVWLDRNEDGVQQQNEFEQAIFQDLANFLRVTILTNDFVKSNNVAYSQSMDLEPSVFFKKRKKGAEMGWSWLGRLSSRSLFKIERKTIASADVLAFNPFELNVADTSLLSIGSTIRNVIYINRTETKFRMELQQSDVRTKTLLNIGFDSRSRSDYSIQPSVKLGEFFRMQFSGTYGFNENRSEFFPDRDYALQILELKPQLIYMQKTMFRTSLQYKYKDSRNSLGALETAKSHDITVDAKYSKSGKSNTSIKTSFSWVNLKYSGLNNTAVQFAMTEGLQNGQNFLWTLSFDRTLSKNIQLNIGYEGRKTGIAPVVHVGRAQIRAVF
jgi:hypothetical protein